MLLTAVQPHVVAATQALVEQELGSKSGICAAGLKVAYKGLTAFAPGYQQIVETLLPGWIDALEPYSVDFNATGGSQFGDYLAKRPEEVSEALLSVTDAAGRESARPTVVKLYNAVRGGATKHIEAALPNLGPWCRNTPGLSSKAGGRQPPGPETGRALPQPGTASAEALGMPVHVFGCPVSALSTASRPCAKE